MITAIRKQRLLMGLSQRQLAEVFNVSSQCIGSLELQAYRPISEKWRRNLSEIFGVPESELFMPDGYNRLVEGPNDIPFDCCNETTRTTSSVKKQARCFE